VTQGQTYHIEVASYSNNGGQLTLNVTPFTTNWVIKSPMSVPRTRLATAAVNGKVYVIGGESWMAGLQSSGGKGDIGFRASALPSALPTGIEEYNPVTDTWANKAPKPTGVSNISAGVVNNKIYVVGGWNGSSCTSVVEAYDPATNTWATVASLPSGLCGVAAAGVNDKLYAIGGGTTSGTAVPTCSVYDPPSNSWSSCAAMTYPRFWAGAGVVNGKIYIVGGGDFAVPNSNYVEEYDPTTNTWITRAPLSTARGGLGAVGVGNYLYVCGGGTGTYLSTCERYDPAANNWSSFDTMYVGRAFLGMAVANGKLYAEGGENWNAGGFLATNEENAVTTCYSLTTSVNPGGTGSISASPAPNCGTQYTTGTVVTLTANANSGYAFSNWSGDASGSANPTGIVMDGNKSVIANFTACYTLTTSANPSGSGTVNASPAPNCGSQYVSGTVVALTANANSGYAFSNWSGDASGSSNPVSVTMDGAKSVTANFTQNCYTLTTSASPSSGGSVSANPAPNCNSGTQYTHGTVVQLTATANTGYTFSSWSGDASGSSNPVSVTMDGAKSVTARFIQQAPPVFPLYLPIILR
jgi:N-acetylneuraminic acid mutarotase